jgi:hypothetical protein
MKKIFAIVSSLFLVSIVTAKAEIGIGISGAVHSFDASGSETTRSSGQINKGTHSETTAVPEVFFEILGDNGGALGLSYIPTRDVGSKSRSDSNTDGDTGTYTAKAELDNVVSLYADMPLGSVLGSTMYLKAGLQHVEIVTLESLNSGSAYPNKSVMGVTAGLGFKGDIPYGNNLYYKGELTYTDFKSYEAESQGNKLSADLDDTAARLSIGYKF